jgi:hypothetical protein
MYCTQDLSNIYHYKIAATVTTTRLSLHTNEEVFLKIRRTAHKTCKTIIVIQTTFTTSTSFHLLHYTFYLLHSTVESYLCHIVFFVSHPPRPTTRPPLATALTAKPLSQRRGGGADGALVCISTRGRGIRSICLLIIINNHFLNIIGSVD